MENNNIIKSLNHLYACVDNSELKTSDKETLHHLIIKLISYYKNKYNQIFMHRNIDKYNKKILALDSSMMECIVIISNTMNGKADPNYVINMINSKTNDDHQKKFFKIKRLKK